jgi:hypothetical protein
MPNNTTWERSSIGRAFINAWMQGTGIDTSCLQVFFVKKKSMKILNIKKKEKERRSVLFYKK